MKEIWKTIVRRKDYEISSLGRVRRCTPGKNTYVGKILAGCLNREDGYIAVSIGTGHPEYVHVLVADAFLGPCPKGKEVNHKDGVKPNCKWDNLEYLTHKENKEHATAHGLVASGERNGRAKLTKEQVEDIRKRALAGEYLKDLALEYDLCLDALSAVARGKTYNADGKYICSKASFRKGFPVGACHPNFKLTGVLVREIKRRGKSESARVLAKEFKVCAGTIYNALRK